MHSFSPDRFVKATSHTSSSSFFMVSPLDSKDALGHNFKIITPYFHQVIYEKIHHNASFRICIVRSVICKVERT